MKHLFAIITFIVLTNISFAQISTTITPQSVKHETVRQSIDNLPVQNLPEFDRERIFQEDENTVNSNRYAAPLTVNYTLSNAGKWINLPNGDGLWIFKIKAQGALSIQAMYRQFKLPEGATLHIYDEDKTTILGAFTSMNNRDNGNFATAVMKGDNMTFEYYVPAAKRGQGVIEINRIDYGYRNTLSKPTRDKKGNGFGDSGSCNVNINCTAGNNWQDEKEGVVRISVVTTQGSFWCTGSLINNANSDGTPYLLSAYHCQDNGTPQYGQWSFYFNYEAVGCTNPATQPTLQTVVGASEKAKESTSDFLLIELSNVVPSAYNPYYNGWDKSGTAPSDATCIHHPSGDIKKIAVDNQSPTISGYGGGSGTTHWQTVWNVGTTEGGSSGSPLFNANGQIIGQLHGGSASCSNLLGPDYYGRFSVSWTGGGTNTTRLSNWLDPSATGVTSVNGYTPSGGGGTGLINGCAGSSQYPSTAFTPSSNWQTTASNIYAGEYSVYNVVAGTTYEWSLCGADGGSVTYDSELTLTDGSNNELAYNNDNCGTASKITWTATITGTVRVHVTENHCQSNSTNTTLVYRSVASSGLPNLTQQTANLSISGNSVTISATIENNGTAAAGTFDVRVYASTTPSVSTSSAPIYTTTVTSLAAGANTVVGNTIDLCTAGLTNGTTYYFGYIIDYNNQITESNENDNAFVSTTQTATLNCNSGCISASQYPSNTFTPTTTWQTASSLIYAGEYSVYNVVAGTTYEWSLCTADGGNASYDSELTLTDASNNFLVYVDDFCGDDAKISWVATLTGAVRVHVSQYNCQSNSTNTTLVYRSVANNAPNLTKQTDNLTVSGNTVTVSATVENDGNAAAGAFDVRFYASSNATISTSDIPIYTATVNSLAAGANTTVGSTIDLCAAGLTDGSTYYIGYIIDYNNVITESDETDNTWAWTTQTATLNCITGCIGASQYPSNTFTPAIIWQTASTTIYAGEYSVYNVVAGVTYEWSLCTADGGNASYDSELTLTDANNNFLAYVDDFCGDDAKISWVATFTGTVRVHVSQYNCQSNSINTTLVYRNIGGSAPNLTLAANSLSLNMSGNVLSLSVDVENNGTAAAGAFDVRFYASTNTTISTTDTEIYLSTVNGLATNGMNTISFTVDLCNIAGFNPSGNYYIGFLIDEPDQVIELDETDNGFYVSNAVTVNCITNYIITTNVNPAGAGTVTGGGTYSDGSSATLTATPNAGWLFNSWKENGITVSTNPTYTFTVNADRTLEAVFTQVQYTIAANVNPAGAGTVTGGGTYNDGTSATLTATPNAGWLFNSWKENGSIVSTNPTYTFTVNADRTLEAAFDFDVNTVNVLNDAALTVSPNPTRDIVNIQINHPTLSFDRIQVFNVHGQLIKSANMNNSTAQLDLSSFSEGVYFLQVFTVDNQQFVIKQIIKMD